MIKINNFMATELITRLADWWRDEIFGGHVENFARNEKCFIWCWLLFAITRKARKKFLKALGLRFIVCRAADKKWEILNHNSHRVRPTFCHASPYLFKPAFHSRNLDLNTLIPVTSTPVCPLSSFYRLCKLNKRNEKQILVVTFERTFFPAFKWEKSSQFLSVFLFVFSSLEQIYILSLNYVAPHFHPSESDV